MLLDDEWRWLVLTIAEGKEIYGVPSSERLLLYETAIVTGLRVSELRSLTRGRLYLGATEPYITCKAASTKNHRDARQFISRDLANRLQGHIASKLPRAPIFNMPNEKKLPAMVCVDLAIARAAW
jgi:hypothetical protein